MGDLAAVGQKLYELDVDIQADEDEAVRIKEEAQSKKTPSKDEAQHTNMELIGSQERSNRGLLTNRDGPMGTHESDQEKTFLANNSNKTMLNVTPIQV